MRSPKYKVSRKLGCNLWGRAKDPFNFKNYFPGQHGQSVSRRLTPYGAQLNGKQKMRHYYNIGENQFANTLAKAAKKSGDTGENFVSMLEKRLDIILYRANFVPTVFAARQVVSHGHVLLNGKRVNIRSAMVREGDTVSLKEKAYTIPCIEVAIKKQERRVPAYLSLSEDNKSIKIVRDAKFAEIPYEVEMNLQMVIEYYSH